MTWPLAAPRHTGRPSHRPRVSPVFVAVRGRARLRVEGLRGKPLMAARLEDLMAGQAAVHSAWANPTTGTVLILFDATRLALRSLIASVARHATDARNGARRRTGSEDAWHTLPRASVAERLGTTVELGMSAADASARLAAVGTNHLPTPRPKSTLAILGDQLASVPVLVLAGAATLSLATGAVVEAVAVLGVVAANTLVGYLTERRVERILTSLQNDSVPQVVVRRDGLEMSLSATVLVPGDLVLLNAGDDVPADGRLVAGDGLTVDESALTGESAPVTKEPSIVCSPGTPLADRANMVYAGTVVTQASGMMIVTGTGRSTEVGQISALVAETSTPPTPLERELDRTGRRLVGIALGLCAATLGVGLLRGVPGLEMLRSVVSLAVAAVPEGLPAVATTTLALGMHRMMRHGIIVRRLAAVEGLGATTVICADKTGTLTENRMTVHSWHVAGREYRHRNGDASPVSGNGGPAAGLDPAFARALTIGVLCNEAELDGNGSATEGALLRAALDAGLDYRAVRKAYPLLSVWPRLNGENWMATRHAGPAGVHVIAVKGAPEQVVERATRWLGPKGERRLTATAKRRILAANARIAARGMRVLGLAFKEIEAEAEPTYGDLVWVGLVGLADPVRAGVREAIAACRSAGIRTVILTGDQAHTAAAVWRELDVAPNGNVRVLEASRLAGGHEAALRSAAGAVDVFARVSPVHKYHIVRALQAAGEVVAMTGDGVNDAAALKASDIGVAMGGFSLARGGQRTAVARDVADAVLLEDDFGSIVRAVQLGRSIRDNISRSLRFLLSTNLSEILVTLGALAVGIARPLSAIQLLWINLVSDVLPALALAIEPPEADVMARPPRDPAEPILSRPVLTGITGEASLLAATTLGVYGLALSRYGAGPHATTLAFTTLTASQLVHALSCRSRVASTGSRVAGGLPLLAVVGGSLGLQALAVTAPPLRRLLGTTPLSLADWTLLAGGIGIPLITLEVKHAAVKSVSPVQPSVRT